MALKHDNSGKCVKCLEIILRYPGFHEGLRNWFLDFQYMHPEAHISCAGRGKDDQEALFQRKASRAHYGESAHNYNAALDLFENTGKTSEIYETEWFHRILALALPDWVTWYGRPGSKFYELPHIEVAAWKELKEKGDLRLVE